jgi:enamine deaminase RidA (YjgF/YER057c/UK114 family)
MAKVESTLADMGIELPQPVAPVADYVPFVRTGKLVFVSGQVPIGGDGVITGQLDRSDHAADGVPAPGSKLGLAVGAATLCAVNVLAQLKAAVGDLDRVTRVVKLTGFVNADSSFTQHPQVVNGASSLMIGAFGDKGRHARAAVGCSSLPLGAICEVEAIFEVE